MDSHFYGESSKGRKFQDDFNQPKSKRSRNNYQFKKNLNQSDENCDQIFQVDCNMNCQTMSNYLSSSRQQVVDQKTPCCVDSLLQNSEISQTRDYLFLKWHNRQMVRYCIENKINSAVEECLGDSPPDLNISDIVEEVESDIEIKDEGILMAIESHGLRRNESLRSTSDTDVQMFSEECPHLLSRDYSIDDVCAPEVNSSDFLNTAVSTAIFEKGLTQSSNN